MTDTTAPDRVNELIQMCRKRGYVSPPRDPVDYSASFTCQEALDIADALSSIPALIAEAVEAAAQQADEKAKYFEMTASMSLPIMSGTVARDRAKVAREIAAAIRTQTEGQSHE